MKKIIIIICILVSILTINTKSNALDLSALLGGGSSQTSASNEKKQTALNLDNMATYNLSDDYIYEGVIFDSKFPQKKYTYIKNLDCMILYGNRSLYEEMKKYTPWISEEDFKSSFSENDLKDIIASAAGGQTSEVLYGSNKFYETIKQQEIEDAGVTKVVNSIIDMYFADGYIYSFSYSYKDKQDGLNEYREALKTFKIKSSETSAMQTTSTEKAETKEEKVDINTIEAPKELVSIVDPKVIEEIPSTSNNENEEKKIKVEDIKKEESNKEENKKEENKKEENKLDEDEKTIIEENLEDSNKIIEEATINPGEANEEGLVIVKNNEDASEPNENSSEDYTTNVPTYVEPVQNINPVVLEKIESKPLYMIALSMIWNNKVLRYTIFVLLILDITIIVLVRRRRKKKKAENSADKIDKTK